MLQADLQHNAPQPPLNVGANLVFARQEGQSQGLPLQGIGGDQPSMFLPFRFFPAEREVAARKEELTVSQRAEKYRVVTKGKIKGPWRNENNPALVGVMDTYGVAAVRKIVLCKCIQGGGTEFAYNCVFTEMMTSSNLALYAAADESTTDGQMTTRLIPMVEKSPALAKLKSTNPYDITKKRITLKNGFTLKTGWGTSLVSVASDPVPVVIVDEADKWEDWVIFEEACDRTTTFADTYKIVVLSVPRTDKGILMRELESCDEIRDYHVPCLFCGVTEPMKFGNQVDPGGIKWPKEQSYKQVRRHQSAYYECPHCLKQWSEYKRKEALLEAMVNGGANKGWEARVPVNRPRFVGFHFPAWISPFVSLSDIAARYIKAKEALAKGDDAPIKAWTNNIAAEPYVNERSERKEDAILALKDDRPRGLVPKAADCLICLIDTQQKGFYYEVRAFEHGASLTSWQVREGFVESFEGLKQILYNDEYLDSDGTRWVITYAFIDSGGGTGTVPKHSRTAEVYKFCQLNPGVRPLKGRQTMASKTAHKIIDHFPNSKLPIPGGITLYNINVTYFKNQLTGKLQVNPGDPGAWNLHSETPEDYGRQMCAEYQDGKGHWQCPKGKANHYWDLGVYALAAAEILQLKFKKKDTAQAATKPVRKIHSKGVAHES